MLSIPQNIDGRTSYRRVNTFYYILQRKGFIVFDAIFPLRQGTKIAETCVSDFVQEGLRCSLKKSGTDTVVADNVHVRLVSSEEVKTDVTCAW